MNTKRNLLKISLSLHSLSVLKGLLQDKVIGALSEYLDSCFTASKSDIADKYSAFVYNLYKSGTDSLTEYIKKAVNEEENIYITAVGAKKTPPLCVKDSLIRDLDIMGEIASLTPEDLKPDIEEIDSFPSFSTKTVDIKGDYLLRIKNIGKYGYGIYAKHHMFYIGTDGLITPVHYPDTVRLSDLADYEREKKIILDNTKALISGSPAANILLTGDAGTGKSSTVKAIVNELYTEGLRIIEVRKEQLKNIPAILDELSLNPLKFIIFIDDLSFGKDDDSFSTLKAILEGSVSAKSKNVVIYATSNRRHLVKERFSDREGDDIHFNDTTQEIMSLSERFGIQVTFCRPDKKTYLDIVHTLADKNGISYDPDKLDAAAERFVLSRSARSARAAKQFIDTVIAGNSEDVFKM